MTTKPSYTPARRFPDFLNDGEWEVKRLGEIAELYAGATPSTTKSEYWKGGTIPWMSSGEVHNGQIFQTEKKITTLGYDNCSTKLVPPNSVVVALAGQGKTRGTVAITRIQLCTNQSLCSIIPNSNYCSDYLYFYLGSQYEVLRQISSGDGTRGGLNLQMLKDFLIPFPPLAEQRRIAASLSALDEMLAATNGKLEQMKAYKKGLMQKLFPAKGKKLPELRFKEFEKDGEWEEKKFGEIISVNSGRDYKHLNYGNIPVYGTGGYMLSVDDKLSDIDAVGIGRKGTIDKPQYLKAPFWTVDTLFFLTNRNGNDIQFIYYSAQTVPWKKYGEQTGVPSLSKLSIENLDVVVPPTILEQRKIAQTLLPLDKELDSLSQKIELLGKQKKGLMKQLFIC